MKSSVKKDENASSDSERESGSEEEEPQYFSWRPLEEEQVEFKGTRKELQAENRLFVEGIQKLCKDGPEESGPTSPSSSKTPLLAFMGRRQTNATALSEWDASCPVSSEQFHDTLDSMRSEKYTRSQSTDEKNFKILWGGCKTKLQQFRVEYDSTGNMLVDIPDNVKSVEYWNKELSKLKTEMMTSLKSRSKYNPSSLLANSRFKSILESSGSIYLDLDQDVKTLSEAVESSWGENGASRNLPILGRR